MDSSQFESPWLCIETAREFIEDYMRLAAAYQNDDPCQILKEQLPDGGWEHSIAVVKPAPSKMRARMAGAVTELRNALDQATFAASNALGTSCEAATYFPAMASPDDATHTFEARKGRCRGVPAELRPFLMALKPWRGGDDLLYRLTRIAGPNKHRVSLRSHFAVNSVFISNMTVHKSREMLMPPYMNRENTKATFLRLQPDGHATYNAQFGINIVFAGDPQIAGTPVAPFLHAAFSKVQGIVAGIEAETHRLLGEPMISAMDYTR